MPSKTWSELLNDAEEAGGGFSVIPADSYDFVIVKSEARKSSNQKDMFNIQAKVINGPSQGKNVFNNFVISPESPVSLRIFFQQMKVLGLTGENLFNSNPTPEQIASALYGKAFKGTVIIEKDNKGEDRNVIKNFATVSDAVKAEAATFLANQGGGNGGTPSAVPDLAAMSAAASTPAATPTSAPPAPPAAPTAPAAAPAAPPAPPAAPAPAPAPAAQPAAPGSIPPPPPAPSF